MKKRLNVIDIFIILAVVCSLIGVGLRMYIDNVIKSKTEEFVITIQFNGISEENKDKLSVGDKAEWKEKLIAFGDVCEVEYDLHRIPVIDGENQYTEVVENGKIDMTVKIKVIGEMTENGFKFGEQYYLYCGMDIIIETQNFEATAVIMDISNEKE